MLLAAWSFVTASSSLYQNPPCRFLASAMLLAARSLVTASSSLYQNPPCRFLASATLLAARRIVTSSKYLAADDDRGRDSDTDRVCRNRYHWPKVEIQP